MKLSKTCTKCGQTKPLTSFVPYNNGYGAGHRSSCKNCRNSSTRGTRAEASAKYYAANAQKIRDKNKKYYALNQERLVESSNQYYKDNKEIVGLRAAAKRYNISIEKAKEMKAAPCAICGADGSLFQNSMHIDHCHRTGKVRGTLCHHCNLTLGFLKDDVSTLDKIKDYLNEHK
jgi:hypothetical protein